VAGTRDPEGQALRALPDDPEGQALRALPDDPEGQALRALRGPRIVYVAGANRSGSTLLEVLLASHPALASAGELFNAARALRDPSAPCTCGKSLGECPLWGGVAVELEALARARGMSVKELAKAVRRVEDREALAGYLRGRSPAAEAVALYRSVQGLVFERVARTRPGASFLLDPSKSEYGAAARPLALRTLLDADLRVLHLVRDPRGVVSSALKGSNKTLIRGEPASDRVTGMRALASWLRVNRGVARVIERLGAERALRVRFEELVAEPTAVVDRICAFLALDPAPILAALEGRELARPEHMIAGNRLRFAPIRLDPSHARAELPWYYALPCAAAARLVG
jgi:hypothetical protein